VINFEPTFYAWPGSRVPVQLFRLLTVAAFASFFSYFTWFTPRPVRCRRFSHRHFHACSCCVWAMSLRTCSALRHVNLFFFFPRLLRLSLFAFLRLPFRKVHVDPLHWSSHGSCFAFWMLVLPPFYFSVRVLWRFPLFDYTF